MNKFNTKHLLLLILICAAGFVLPFITRSNDESINTTLSTSFTIVGGVISIITLIVAVLLFDRFGFNTKFKEKQLETVLSLISNLQVLSFSVITNRFTYLNYLRQCKNLEKLPDGIYDVDKNKIIMFPDNFEELTRELQIIRSSPWLPSEIKLKLNFLNIYGVHEVEDFHYSKYVKLDINRQGEEPWMVSIPSYTFQQFSTHLNDMLKEITKWLKNHSTVDIDFSLLQEPHN